MSSNADLRRKIRLARKALAPEDQWLHASSIRNLLLESNLFDSAKSVAAYLCSDGEVDVDSVIDALLDKEISVYVPVVEGHSMRFATYTKSTRVLTNKWDIREPENTNVVQEPEFDFVLVPLVAFSDAGDRLGRGGGFYDRFFANIDSALLIGIAHELQRVKKFDTNPWDKKLDAVVTERGVTICSARVASKINVGKQDLA